MTKLFSFNAYNTIPTPVFTLNNSYLDKAEIGNIRYGGTYTGRHGPLRTAWIIQGEIPYTLH